MRKKRKGKKPIWKNKWLWGIIGVLIIIGILAPSEESTPEEKEEAPPIVNEQPATTEPTEPAETPNAPEEIIIEPVIDVQQIAGKSMEEVFTILGEPASVEEENWGILETEEKIPATIHYYMDGVLEVMFLEEKAARIRVNLVEESYFTEEEQNKNIAYLGLPIVALESAESAMQNSFYAYDIEGYYAVSTGHWVGTNDGWVLLITEERYR